MSIRSAKISDTDIVREITHTTIRAVYPHYYPTGAVKFFLEHHSEKSIVDDINNNCVYLCCDENGDIAGTVTVRKNEILRLFVLPKYQDKGHGKEMLEFAEQKIAKSYDEIVIDASFAAKAIYLKRGYKEVAYNTIKTAGGDYLCYDIMKKKR